MNLRWYRGNIMFVLNFKGVFLWRDLHIMKYEIRYLSKLGNTKKIALAISEVVGVVAKDLSVEMPKNVDILFLGCAVYGFDIDEQVKNFINGLDDVKKVAIFSTSSISKCAFKRIVKLLEKKRIPYFKDNFYCKGEYKFLNKNKPNISEIEAAKLFAKRIMKEGI